MVVFRTKIEAERFARKRKLGFLNLLKMADKDDIFKNAPIALSKRKRALKNAIKSVKIRVIRPRRKGERPLFEVIGQ